MYNDAPYIFIIDTNSYAGNFERELCGYVTGVWDNETHGGTQANLFHKEVEDSFIFDDLITTLPTCDDDVPILSPQCLVETPKEIRAKDIYCSIGIFFSDRPTQEMIDLIKDRAYKFEKEGLIFDRPVNLKILGFRLIKHVIKIEEEKL